MFTIRPVKKYSMDIDTADKTLQNVFAALDKEPSRIPFDKMVLRKKQDLRSDNAFISTAIVLLLFTLFLPLFFPHDNKSFISVDVERDKSFVIESHEIVESRLTLSFSESTELDLDKCYIAGADGSIMYPVASLSDQRTIVFPINKIEYNIYIYDKNGECLHMLLSPRPIGK